MYKVWLTIVVLFFYGNVSFTQDLGLGEWQYHVPYQKSIAVADAGNLVYCASEMGMYYFNKTDNSVTRLTRVQGLSDIGISDIAYAANLQLLVVGYNNGNIDLISSNSIINMEGIKRASFPGVKRINKITIKDNYAYLSCGFGIVIVDLVKQEIKDTYFLNANQNLGVNDVVLHNSFIYAATNKGVFYADLNSQNLNDPNQWQRETLLPDSTFSTLFIFQNNIYANFSNGIFRSDTLFYNDGSAWKKQTALYGEANVFFDISGDNIIVCHTDKVITYDKNWGKIQEFLSYGYVAPSLSQAVFDTKNPSQIWGADSWKGLVKISGANTSEIHSVTGPPSTKSHEITVNKNDIWVATGTVQGYTWSNTYSKDGVYLYSENQWKAYNRTTTEGIDSLFDFLSVAVDPIDKNKVFFAIHSDGIVEMKNGKHSKTYGQSNSSIRLVEQATSTYQFTGMTSIAFDSNNILWGANAGATNILVAKNQKDNWFSFNLSSASASKSTGRMLITNNNHIWVTFPNNGGIVAFNYNNTINNKSDDQAVGITKSSSGLPSNYVNAMAQDLSGEIWIGTAEGIAVFRSPSQVFGDTPAQAEKILIQQDGYTEYLLQTQMVTAISIDGANRKWIGTSTSGVFLMSPDGTEELLHFTKENSPLIANAIQAIGVNGQTGEVFFGTEQGICSYKSTATEGNSNYSAIYAYPNPVPPDYYGDIAINGLVANSEIRITDISGNIVYKGFSDGGQAIWNGKTMNGDRVKTGVYLVFCATTDGSQSVATKILFIH